ncbi:hypothetical protein FOZ62_025991, partial [Perkinsus olseni]
AMMVLPVGGADMPVIVSLLNSLSGLATSASGFMMSNSMLVMTGALVTSSGALLSDMMCRGINRSLISVLQGGFGVEDGSLVAPSGGGVAGEVHTIDSAELVRKLADAKKVLIVPGYGMAVARCQQQVSEIANLLRNRNGAVVVFGIHPVAGRLPGHMNVLLAEANVPYDIVLEMEEVNADIATFDLCIVLGANDIVNPTTGSDPSSPIYGMPAIEVWKCRECVVQKRSMATGYSGVENPLFFHENSRMLFGHARDVVDKIRNELADKLPSENVVDQGPSAVLGETGNSAGKDGSSEGAEERVEYPPVGAMVGFVNESIFDDAEAAELERRVAVTPVVTRKLRMLGFDVAFEAGSGQAASFSDEEYELMGATRLKTAVLRRVLLSAIIRRKLEEVYAKADVVLRVAALSTKDVRLSRDGRDLDGVSQVIISTFSVNDEVLELLEQLRAKKVTVVNMAAVPRISRAQKLDVLTSMANIAGYRAVVEAFHVLPRISRPSVTASGHLPAASVFVIGTGVAGLSAVATAQSLGARVYASDVRDTTKEQIESMGATFVRIECRETSGAGGSGGYAAEISSPEFKRAQMVTYAAMVKKVDVVICTAMIPNRRAPMLVTKEMARAMAPHSVIVDLAATAGGNCELTVPGRTVVDAASKVTIVGRTTLTSDMPQQSSTMLSHNLLGMLQLLREGEAAGPANLIFNFDDVLVRQSTLTKDGEMLYPPPPMPQPPAPVPPSLPVGVELPPMRLEDSSAQAVLDYLCDHAEAVAVALGFTVVLALGISADVNNVRLVGDFVLSLLIGHFTVAAVTPALHTPLISVTNAISGVIATGGMLQMNGPFPSGQVISALAAIFFSLVNVSGGFAITHRMLQMFKPAQSRAIANGPPPTAGAGEARQMLFTQSAAPLKFTVRTKQRSPTKFESAFVSDDEVSKALRKILASQEEKPDQFIASLVDHYESGSQWTSTQRAWAHFFATKLRYRTFGDANDDQAGLVFTLLKKPNPSMPDLGNDSSFKSPFKTDEEARAVIQDLSEEEAAKAGSLVVSLRHLVNNERPWPPYLRGWGHYIAHQLKSGRMLQPKVLDDHWCPDTADEDDFPEGTGLRKPPRGVKVTIDSREGLLLDALGHSGNGAEAAQGYEVSRLDVGDVVIEAVGDSCEKLIIERKTVRDLLSSHRDARLRNQLSALLEAVDYQRHRVVVLLEGSVDSTYNTELVYGYMVRLPIRDRLVLLRTESLHETITVLDKIVQSFKKLCAGPTEFTPARVSSQVFKAPKTADRAMINMLMAVKGVSMRTAYHTAKRFPTMQRLVAALGKPGGLDSLERSMRSRMGRVIAERVAASVMGEDWRPIPGLGEEFAERLREAGVRGVQLDIVFKRVRSLEGLKAMLEETPDKMKLLTADWGLEDKAAVIIRLACGEGSAEYRAYLLAEDLAEKVNGITRETAFAVIGKRCTREELKAALPATPSELDAWYQQLGMDTKLAVIVFSFYPSIAELQHALGENKPLPAELKMSPSNQAKLFSLCSA